MKICSYKALCVACCSKMWQKPLSGKKKDLTLHTVFGQWSYRAAIWLSLTENMQALLAVKRLSGCSAVGSASGLGPGGRRFESCHPDSLKLASVFLIDGLCTCFFANFFSLAFFRYSGCSAVGSASGLGPGGRRFESCHPDVKNLSGYLLGRFFLLLFTVVLAAK